MLPLDQVTQADFLPALEQTFVLTAGSEKVPLVLASVNALQFGVPERREPFALTFHGAPALRLRQGIYHLQHHRLGPMEIFLVQTAARAEASLFEAIFN